MSCPSPTPVSGTGRATAISEGPAAAQSAAIAATSGAAVTDALDNTNCPGDCRFKNPQNIKCSVTASGYHTTLFTFAANFFTAGMTKWFGDGWIYEGWANFTWSATAECAESREQVLITPP